MMKNKDKDKLSIIDNNMLSGNLIDVRKGIKDYGIKDFPSDYSDYLKWIFYNKDKDAQDVLNQLDEVLVQMQFIN